MEAKAYTVLIYPNDKGGWQSYVRQPGYKPRRDLSARCCVHPIRTDTERSAKRIAEEQHRVKCCGGVAAPSLPLDCTEGD